MISRVLPTAVVLCMLIVPAEAQGPPPATPQVVSPEVTSDRRIVVRLYAPEAKAVRLNASDIAGVGPSTPLTRGTNGVWEHGIGPVEPGSYRYLFSVDGVPTIDPRNPAASESNTNVWSLVHVPGTPTFDVADVPHGAVAEVTYKSSTLGRFRRAHVYTPPGYETSRNRYPVFYLLHGAGDSDDSWSTVGRAGHVLDNLIAAKKARPMIVVMPAGHAVAQGSVVGDTATDAFVNDFVKDLMPHIERHYRVQTDRASTAIAGLSMGGSQTLAIAIPRLTRFGYIGVFSSGLLNALPLGGRGRGAGAAPAASPTAGPTAWEKANAIYLADAKAKEGLRLLWFSTGKDDFLIENTRATVELFRKHAYAPVYLESGGGHTWLNWRNYLTEFTPQLFQKR